jgi:hypothetical protein
MLYIHGYDGGAPTRRLTDALRIAAPHLFTAGDRNRADLTLIPRLQEDCTADGWYDLHWSHPRMEETTSLVDDGPLLGVTNALISLVWPVGPPPHIPAERRLAAEPPVTLDGIGDDWIRLFGGPDRVREILEARRHVAIRYDRSVDAYDWQSFANDLASAVDALDAPPLTPMQRAHVAAVRLWKAHREVDAARQSAAAHLRNIAGDDVAQVRGLVDLVDPAVAQ